jgi:hypothetical protein
VKSAQQASHPPRPGLTLRVGVSGHRPKPTRLPAAALDRVNAQLRQVFEAIDAELKTLHEANKRIYSATPPRVRIVTGLAEGADQMAVVARPPGWAVDAILPFPQEEYATDFVESAADKTRNVVSQFNATLAEATTIVELPMSEELRGDRNLGYARLGRFLVREIDLLVAVWDGGAEEGPGGTAEVVRCCLDARIPVAWINTRQDRIPPQDAFARMVDTIGSDGRPVAPAADCTKGPLAEAISTIVSLPKKIADGEPAGRDTAGPSVTDRLAGFFAERWPRGTGWFVYDFFRRYAERKVPRLWIRMESLAQRLSEWDAFLGDAPKDDLRGRRDFEGRLDFQDRIREHLLPRYLWADQLATYLAHVYRSAYMTCYLLAALAVFFALVELIIPGGRDPSIWLKTALVIPELLCVTAIVWIYRHGKGRRWHQRWLEYRALAEMLRDTRFLAYFGEYGRIHTTQDADPASSAWLLWYLRATVRELGLPYAVLDGTFQRTHLGSVEEHVIAEQLAYHRRNAIALARMDAGLLRLTSGFFVATGLLALPWLVACVAHVAGFPGLAAFLLAKLDALTFLAAFLPALGAALAGIRETGDFEGFADRSAKTVVALQDLRRDIPVVRRTLSLDDTGGVLISLASILAEDRAAWQSIYGRKRLHLPA